MNAIIESTQGATRKQKAQADLERLKTERQQLQERQQQATHETEQLHQAIAQAERAGHTDQLVTLRMKRQTATSCREDLERSLSLVDQDIRMAEGALHAATVADHAESWNAIQVKQVQLLKIIEDALRTIADALNQKASLAERQQRLVAIVCPGSNCNAALIKAELIGVVSGYLQGDRGLSLRTVDWSCTSMSEQGNLLR